MAGAGTSASDYHLDKVTISIRGKLVGLSPPSNCCIFTVPERLRRTNEEAYTPRVIAIGPYHHLNPSLMPMEYHKLLYLQNFLQRYQNYRLEDYIQRAKSWEYDARNCYDKQIDLDSDQFTEMMLLDGIFVIQLFLMRKDQQMRLPNDRIFKEQWMFKDVCRDMALLENQIPFFVVQRLFEMVFKTHQQPMLKLLNLVYLFFNMVMRKELPESVMESEVKHFVHAISLSFSPSESEVKHSVHASSGSEEPKESVVENKFTLSATKLVAEVKHFVHAISLSFSPSESVMESEVKHFVHASSGSEEPKESVVENKFTLSATKLVAAGVKLKKDESKCSFNITFNNGKLSIPYLALYDSTEHYFRNIIAFEQCYCPDRYLTDYMTFMHHLIETPGDAELLIDEGIIKNWLSNKEAATQVISAFGKENVLSANYYFNSISQELVNHCKKHCNKWKATFKRDYCSSPWAVISVIAAVVLLLLTVAQTVCSVLSLK